MAEVSPNEEWRPVPGYEHTYDVSSAGRVRRQAGVASPPRLRVLRLNKHGYIDVNLSQDNRVVTHRVHKLVMLAFCGPRPDGCEIRHLNGDPTDNRRENLAYGSVSENRLDITLHGHNRNANKSHCANGHEFTPENTKVIPSRPRTRYCRACQNAHQAQRYART